MAYLYLRQRLVVLTACFGFVALLVTSADALAQGSPAGDRAPRQTESPNAEDHGGGRDVDPSAREAEPRPRHAVGATRAGATAAGVAVGDGRRDVDQLRDADIIDGAAAVAVTGGKKALDPALNSAIVCRNPRVAIEHLLYWLQPQRRHPRRASACLDKSGLSSPQEGDKRAQQILDILDARGLYVQVAKISDDPAYMGVGGTPRYTLFSSIPEVYVERIGDRWLWSKETVEAIPQLHDDLFLFNVDAWLAKAPSWLRARFLGIDGWQLLGLALLLVAALLLRTVAMAVVGSQGRRLMLMFKAGRGEDLLAKAARPFGGLAAALFAGALLPALRLPVRLSQAGVFAIRVYAVVSAVWVVYRLVDLFTAWLADRAAGTDTKLDDQLVPLIRRALKLFTVALGTIFVLDNLNIDVAGLLAGLGIGGLAFALAAKDTIANLFGSATIFASRPFQIGDWVFIDGVEGVVESVGFRSTRVRTFYNSLVSVPNAKVADSVVDNYGERQYRRFKATLGLTYNTTPDQMQAFVEGVRAVIKANPATRKDYYEVHFNGFGDFSLNVMLYCFFEVPGWSDELQAKHNMLLEIIRLAQSLGVTFAYPTQTVHVQTPGDQTPAHPALAAAELRKTIDAFGPDGDSSRPGGTPISQGYLA